MEENTLKQDQNNQIWCSKVELWPYSDTGCVTKCAK